MTRSDAAPVGAGLLAVLTLAWLVFALRAAWGAIAANTDTTVVISTVVQALPATVGACLLAGAAAGLGITRLAATGRLRLPPFGRPAVRFAAAGAVAGLVVGVAVGAVVMFAFGTASAIVVLAATVAGAGLLGGAAAGLPAAPLAAGVAATLGAFGTGALISLFQHPLGTLLGRGDTPASQYDAAVRLAIIGAVVEGIVAAVIAYQHLRRRDGGRTWVWPWFLLAGALPGLISVLKIALAQLGGSGLTRIVSGFSTGDEIYLQVIRDSDIRSSLIILFVGGIGAMIAIGRTLSRPAAAS